MMMRCTPRRTLAASAMVALYFLADYEYGKSTGAMQQRQELLRAVAPSHPLQPARDPLLQPEPAPPAALAATTVFCTRWTLCAMSPAHAVTITSVLR